MTPIEELHRLVASQARWVAGNKLAAMYPESGAHSRDKYPKQMAFFALGKRFKTRALIAANRVGKTLGGGGYETVLHLTGGYDEYAPWWPGHRFNKPVDWWAAGDTKETVRDIIQAKLVGPETARGTGLIPADCLGKIRLRPNGNGAIDTVEVLHKPTGRWSLLGFKSYDQGRASFQGTEKDGIWLDEESDEGIRAECALRLMTTGGLLIETFTPLKGLTPIVMKYMEGGEPGESGVLEGVERAVVMAGWDDVPHLGEAEKARMLAESEPHLRDARSKGIPSLGAGAIYPVPEEDIVVDDFALPPHWPRAYGLDVGWKKTAAIWGALDRDTDTLYLYAEHYRGLAEPVIHAAAIKAKGDWIGGAIDPASRGRSQTDGKKLLALYVAEGLELMLADNAVEPGLYDVWQRLSTGKLKVFKSLQAWRSEYRMYRRDEHGKVIKENDHLMDGTRYLVRSGLKLARAVPARKARARPWTPGVPGMGL